MVARDFPRRIEWILECRATGGARIARGVGLLAADSPGVDSADAPGPGGVRRWSCAMTMDPKGPSSSRARVAFIELDGAPRYGLSHQEC